MESIIYLASASPRRTELLTQIGVSHLCQPVDIDETPMLGEEPADYVIRMATSKADAWLKHPDRDRELPVLGADTTVIQNNQFLHKPSGKQDAFRMLRQLSGEKHQVLSAVCVMDSQRCHSRISKTDVHFKELSDEEIELYWLTGEPADKAGAYGIQGLASAFVSSINGSYSGVVGLPLFETIELLNQFGINPLRGY